jgi:hypothetical protein
MITPGMNRQQRRAAARAKRSGILHRTPIDPTASLRALNNARPYDEGEMTFEHLYTRACFERLRDGQGTEEDFDRLSMILNVALIRSETIDPQLVATAQAAQEAMCRMKDRYLRGHRFGFDANGLRDTVAALDDFEVIMDASSPKQMKTAIVEAYRRITNGQVLVLTDASLTT